MNMNSEASDSPKLAAPTATPPLHAEVLRALLDVPKPKEESWQSEAGRAVSILAVEFLKETNEELALQSVALLGLAQSLGVKDARKRVIKLSRWSEAAPPPLTTLAFKDEQQAALTIASLLAHVQSHATPRHASIDVVEPVAAAAELLPSGDNLVRICAVVDVGAGTTDIGLFQSWVPDGVSRVQSKLYSIGQPVSVFKAGNEVDGIVLKLIKTRAKKPSVTALADVRARIRGIKETLFTDGLIQELGCDVRLKDLHSHPEAQAMALEIRAELLRLVQDNAAEIGELLNRRAHPVSRFDVVMAGGGGSIDFVIKAIDKPLPVGQWTVPVDLTIPGDRAGINTFGASRGRMAVALGGASNDYDTLVHEQPPVSTIRRGSL